MVFEVSPKSIQITIGGEETSFFMVKTQFLMVKPSFLMYRWYKKWQCIADLPIVNIVNGDFPWLC
jgi:hypothetical protein